ncbi:MAG: hypothetical protein VST70_08380 [Nitrospirota bacterium]|nr:hypothetical protein [Nitrospirota bacterium]
MGTETSRAESPRCSISRTKLSATKALMLSRVLRVPVPVPQPIRWGSPAALDTVRSSAKGRTATGREEASRIRCLREGSSAGEK